MVGYKFNILRCNCLVFNFNFINKIIEKTFVAGNHFQLDRMSTI